MGHKWGQQLLIIPPTSEERGQQNIPAICESLSRKDAHPHTRTPAHPSTSGHH